MTKRQRTYKNESWWDTVLGKGKNYQKRGKRTSPGTNNYSNNDSRFDVIEDKLDVIEDMLEPIASNQERIDTEEFHDSYDNDFVPEYDEQGQLSNENELDEYNDQESDEDEEGTERLREV